LIQPINPRNGGFSYLHVTSSQRILKLANFPTITHPRETICAFCTASVRLLKEIYSVGVIIWAILAIVAALAIFYTRITIIHMLDLPQTPLRPGQNVSDYTDAILGSCLFGFLSFVLWLLFVALIFIFYRSGIKDMMYG